LPDGRVVGIASEALLQLSFPAGSNATGLPARRPPRLRAAIAKLQSALAPGLSNVPAQSVQEVWRRDGGALIVRSTRGIAYASIDGGAAHVTTIYGTGCWNIADPQFDRFGRAVARALVAPPD
jgi:hypothetical protein